jgi:hypothetical protein
MQKRGVFMQDAPADAEHGRHQSGRRSHQRFGTGEAATADRLAKPKKNQWRLRR